MENKKWNIEQKKKSFLIMEDDNNGGAESIAIVYNTDSDSENKAKIMVAAQDLLNALGVIKDVLQGWNKYGKYTNIIEYATANINKATL